jgi:hypothetical protein
MAVPRFAAALLVGMWTALCAAGAWQDAICLPSDGVGHVWNRSEPALLAGNVKASVVPLLYATPPDVEQRAVDLPRMTLSYVFQGWSGRTARLRAMIDWGAGPRPFAILEARDDGQGRSITPLVGGLLSLTPAGAAARVGSDVHRTR